MQKNIKQGSRHNSVDRQAIQAIHDHSMALGAECSPTQDAGKAKQIILAGLKKLTPRYDALKQYAVQEAFDVQQATLVLNGVMTLTANEAGEGEPDDVQELVDIARALLTFIGGEIDELEQAAPDVATETSSNATTAYMSAKPKPNKTTNEKLLSLSYIKSLHLPIDEQQFRDQIAVKFIGHDEITGYLNLWGDESLVDVETEFFTGKNHKSLPMTDFWDGKIGFPRPLTWDHQQDKNFKAHPVVGDILELGDDELGRWYHAALDRKGQYLQMLGKMISARDLGTSSDSAPQYVVREKMKNGSVWLKQWALFGGALTTTPAEPRMFDTVYWNNKGMDLSKFSTEAQPSGVRADMAKVASLTRELELLRLS